MTSPDPSALHSLQPDPLEPRPDEVEKYVACLQELARTQPDVARRRAWSQIRLAGQRARRRPDEAHASLDRIFRLGTPPEPPLAGPYRGIFVTTTTGRAGDPLLRVLGAAWMPWAGKRFDPLSQTGDNLLRRTAAPPLWLLARGQRPEAAGDGLLAAFPFRTYTAAGCLDPDRETLKIDYDEANPPPVRGLLDELVQVVPGAYLGKALWPRPAGRSGSQWLLWAYFALQPPETVRVPEAAGGLLARLRSDPDPLPA